MTLERLAELTHQELLALGKRMDNGFERMNERMNEGFKRTEDGFSAVTSELELIHGDIRELMLTR